MDPAQNIDAGATYLSQLMARYGTSQAALQRVIAAYNAGPGNLDKYHGIPPFKETRSYVKWVLGFYRYFKIKRLF
jgi:soluble lytic murein transglycosylase-like protein